MLNKKKMYIIQYTSWNPGLAKIPLQKLLQEHAGLSLGESKEVVDKLLRNKHPEVIIDDEERAIDLIRKSLELGAVGILNQKLSS